MQTGQPAETVEEMHLRIENNDLPVTAQGFQAFGAWHFKGVEVYYMHHIHCIYHYILT